MIVIEVKIPQWKDITKWFWDKFCFPRRKVVAEYFEWYNERLVSELIDYLHEHGIAIMMKTVSISSKTLNFI